jgi:hypothetical protein
VKGLSLFKCSSDCGALYFGSGVATESRSNFTRLKGAWADGEGYAVALHQQGASSSTSASFLLVAECHTGHAVIWRDGGTAQLTRCSFLDNPFPVGVVGHWAGDAQTIVLACFIKNTNLCAQKAVEPNGREFFHGSVLVDSCLYAGTVPAVTLSFIPTGVQVSHTSTELEFNTASQLPTCRGPTGGFQQTKMVWNDVVDDIEVVTVHRPSPSPPPGQVRVG